MVRKRREPHQYAFVFECRDAVADDLGGLRRRRGPNRCATFFNVLRAGSGMPARYSSTFFGGCLLFVPELRLPDFALFMRTCYESFWFKSMPARVFFGRADNHLSTLTVFNELSRPTIDPTKWQKWHRPSHHEGLSEETSKNRECSVLSPNTESMRNRP